MNNKQYAAAKLILRSPKDNRILLISREIDGEIGFEPAGGKVDADFSRDLSETFEECAIREVREELGLEARITHYIGSYYFFWSIQKGVCSHCVVFLGDILSGDIDTFSNPDGNEHFLKPEWVSLKDIKLKRIPIKKHHVGLSELLIKAAHLIELEAIPTC